MISEQIKYKNHINEVVEFGSGLYLAGTELHNHVWNYHSENNRISAFERGIRTIPADVVIACASKDDAIAFANRLYEIADKDVLAQSEGRLSWGEYYLKCYITESKVKEYNSFKGLLTLSLTIATDFPAWIKETSQSFNNSGDSDDGYLDFAFDFPYDFASSSTVKEIINTNFSDSDFKLIVYGEVTNPSINIGSHEYAVTGHIDSDEYLEIDSKNKTITLVKQNGQKVNWFKYRDKESYIFQKIPSGAVAVSWQGDYQFDITLYEERSEPKWT